MKINNLTFDEIISYGELGEISLSTSEDFEYLERLVIELEDHAFRRGSDESADSYDAGYEDGKEYGYEEGKEEGYDIGYAEGLVAND